MLDEVEQAAIGPLEVLEGHDHRSAVGDPLEQGAPGREEDLALATSVFSIRCLESQQAAQRRFDSQALVLVGHEFDEHDAQLVERAVSLLRLGDARTLPDHLRQGPERDPVPIRGAASGMPVRRFGQSIQVLLQLPAEPGLADASLSGDQHKPNPALVGGNVIEILQQAQL